MSHFEKIMQYHKVERISVPYQEWRGCSIKHGYGQEAEADKEVNRLNLKNRGAKLVHSYECNFCGLWHVGGAS